MEYKYASHAHCFTEEEPPCGFKGFHCCLCDIATKHRKVPKGIHAGCMCNMHSECDPNLCDDPKAGVQMHEPLTS